MSDDSDDNPNLTDVLIAAIETAQAGLRTNLPGQIMAYDPDEHRANVQIMVPDPFKGEDGARRPQAVAVIPDVPVAHLGFGGGIRIKIPVRKGDQCWLSFSSSCLASYKASGGKFLDPRDDRRHHEADVVVLPFSTVALTDAAALIEFTADGHLLLGNSAAINQALLSSPFLSAFATLITAISVAVGTSGTPAGATAAAADILSALTTFQSVASSYLSNIVKLS